MTAHAPGPQDPVQIIARFVRGNWDLPEQVGAGLIEELASEGWIITRAQVFADMLASLKAVVADVLEYERINNLAPNPGRQFCWDSVARAHAAIAKATEGQS